jgi:hypothetical protein
LKAAMVNASRAWKYAHTRCMTFLKESREMLGETSKLR